MHFRDRADSEYVIYLGVGCKGTEFTSNKQTNKLTNTLKYRHSALYNNTGVKVKFY